jgi:phosphoenolpyruvate-protein kinase (PTS system EI component)
VSRRRFAGHAASTGTAAGVLYRTDRPPSTMADPTARQEADPVGRLTEAFETVAADLRATAEKLRGDDHTEQADIIEVIGYLAMDPDLRALAVRHVTDGTPLDQAVRLAVDHHADTLAALPDPVLAERATDVRQVGKRVRAHLSGHHRNLVTDLPLILVATEIGAADLLDPSLSVTAAASVTGGPNSHAAIVARSLGIPLLVGIDPAVLDHPDGAPATVDGTAIVINPDPDEQVAARRTVLAARQRRELLAAERHLPAATTDRHPVTLRANIATPAEARTAMTANADGVGLLRTELPFLDAAEWPTEAQHAAVLAPILAALKGKPVTIRTLDYADDKLPPFLARGRTGRLGRGLPLMLAEPDAFARQFRAIIRAAGNDIRIMIPMVASVEELHACQQILAHAAHDLDTQPPPLGIMVELPEAVAAIDDLARHADFLSLGTNDLTGKILGLDRRDPTLTPELAAHPAVLRAIADTIAAAHQHQRKVSVCGDAAAHPHVIPLLIGLDCDILSVTPAALDQTRATIRRLNHTTCATTARTALAHTDADQVWDAVRQHCAPELP